MENKTKSSKGSTSKRQVRNSTLRTLLYDKWFRRTFKKRKLGKGFLANRKEPGSTRPILRITEPAEAPAKG